MTERRVGMRRRNNFSSPAAHSLTEQSIVKHSINIAITIQFLGYQVVIIVTQANQLEIEQFYFININYLCKFIFIYFLKQY